MTTIRKSCLKSHYTPPLTPDVSAPPTPGGSGRTSPTPSSSSGSSSSCCWTSQERPPLCKRVSFCEESLEEIFPADEWDRSPHPVTPKLSYQDMLELKQLQISVPRPSPSLSSPLQASLPPSTISSTFNNTALNSRCTSSSSTSAPFPLSRFASQPSHTPSRWKNRIQQVVDPDILPYLEAVPIRLLPLLDNNSPTPSPTAESQENVLPPSMSRKSATETTVPDSTSIYVSVSETPKQKPTIPTHPYTPLLPSPPSISIVSPPSTFSQSRTLASPSSYSPGPDIASDIISRPLSSPTPVLPSPSPASSSPAISPKPSPPLQNWPPRRSSFAFLPLLPVQEPPPAPPTPPAEEQPKPAPRKLNMTFLPLMAPVEVEPKKEGAHMAREVSCDQSRAGTGSSGSTGPDHTPTLGPVADEVPHSDDLVLPTAIDASVTAPIVSLGQPVGTPTQEDTSTSNSCASSPDLEHEQEPDAESDMADWDGTPTLSSASESEQDTDVDTDLDTNTDVEDADPAGLTLEGEGKGKEHAAPGVEIEYFSYTHPRMHAIPLTVRSTAGQTPPLGAMYPDLPLPSPVSGGVGAGASVGLGLPGLGLGNVVKADMESGRVSAVPALQKIKLAALPSPALVPPSPLSLDGEAAEQAAVAAPVAARSVVVRAQTRTQSQDQS